MRERGDRWRPLGTASQLSWIPWLTIVGIALSLAWILALPGIRFPDAGFVQSRVFPIASMIFAVFAARFAWVVADWRSAGLLAIRSVRSPWVYLWWVGVLMWAAVLVVCLFASLVGQVRFSAFGPPDVGLLLMWVFLSGWALTAGAALGSLLPRWIAAPAALVVVYVVQLFPGGMSPPWLRHLFGFFDATDSHFVLSWRAVMAVMGTSTLLAAAFLTITASVRRRIRRPHSSPWAWLALPLPAVAVGVALLGFGPLVRPLGYTATIPRTDVTCTDLTVRWCVLPQNLEAMGAAREVDAVFAQAEAEGLAIPATVTETLRPTPWPTVEANLDHTAGDLEQFVQELTVNTWFDDQHCRDQRGLRTDDRVVVQSMVADQWWRHTLAERLGVTEPNHHPDYLTEFDVGVHILNELPADQRVMWLNAVSESMRDCRGQVDEPETLTSDGLYAAYEEQVP